MEAEGNKILYLCNYDLQIGDEENDLVKKLWSGDWSINDMSLCKEILATGLEIEALKQDVKRHMDNEETMDKILHMAICAFLTFCDRNWDGHPKEFNLEQYFEMAWPKDLDAAAELQRDSEPLSQNILNPELLFFSNQVFSALLSVKKNLPTIWWSLRVKVIHQRCLDDTSPTLLAESELIIDKLYNASIDLDPRLKLLMYTEISQAHLIYSKIQKVDELLLRVRVLAGLKLELTGVLGKRTKFQQFALPQLALTSKLDKNVERKSADETHGSCQLPPQVELQDDVRLNKILFNEEVNQDELPSLEQTACLLTVQFLQKSQPHDDLMTEELQPYLDIIMSQEKGPWSTRVAALLIRCKIEGTHKRTVERAMLQCETIVNDKTGVSAIDRLSYLWASGLPPAWTWRHQLADLYLSLGLVKTALDEYQRVQLWEDVVLCYTMLQLRHKAAEVIQQQIDIKPTVKLYCLLGDATDDVSCYEKAWEFSNCKSSRAQRHWGNFFFDHKQYEECIPHYEKSVEINSLQEAVWLRLGYAALYTENWELSAKAYRRFTCLQPNTFEAWNNLAKVYVKQGDKQRAYRALGEALRYNYDNWKLWENVVVVSMDTGHFESVINGCHRLLDIQRKYEDVEVLRLLVRAILQDETDADGNSAARLRKKALKLFGRITSVHQNNPEIWQLYSDLSTTYLTKAWRLLKAYKGYTQNGNWPDNPDTCKKVLELTKHLLEYSLKAKEDAEEKDHLQANEQLSSARLTGKAVFNATRVQAWPGTEPMILEVMELLNRATCLLQHKSKPQA